MTIGLDWYKKDTVLSNFNFVSAPNLKLGLRGDGKISMKTCLSSSVARRGRDHAAVKMLKPYLGGKAGGGVKIR